MVKKNLWGIAKTLVLLLAVAGLIFPAFPARAQSIEFDGATISVQTPAGYEVEETETKTSETGIASRACLTSHSKAVTSESGQCR